MTDLLERKRERERENKKTLRHSLRDVRSRYLPEMALPGAGPTGCPVSSLTIPTDSVSYTVLKACGIRKVESNCSRAVYQHMYGTSSPISLHMEARFPHSMLEL